VVGETITYRRRTGGWWWWVADLDKRLAVLGRHVHEGVPLSRGAADAGVPVRTARRWRAAYEADGAAGLARMSPYWP